MKTATLEANQLMLDGAITLAQIEANGMKIDVPYLDKTIKEVTASIKLLEQEIRADKVFTTWRKVFGERTKLGSREQLAHILFEKMEYEAPEKTETGKHKADKDSLNGVDLPFVKKYLKIEKLKKIKSTYLGGIRSEVDSEGFLRPFFNLHTTVTFRGSGDSPNFQNIPIRDPEMGEIVRRCFIPRNPNRHIVEIDYSGIEVRIAACYHKDPVMMEYINDPTKDMHRDMAAQLYCCSPDQVSKEMRFAAKNGFVFAEFYGDYYIHCAKNLWNFISDMDLKLVDGTPVKEHLKSKGITRLGICDPKQKPDSGTFERHIKAVEDDFWNKRFGVYGNWKKRWSAEYKRTGGFDTLTGFRIDGIMGKNDIINYPVQGSAFHCLLWSLIRIHRFIKKNKMKSRIIGQIHDSIIADIPENELQLYLTMAKRIMTQELLKAWKWIIVPLDVEAEVSPLGESWFSKSQWIEKDGLWQLKAKK